MFRKTGPGMLIAAAFIGPGTVTTCLRAGVENGYSLLWALLLSVGATIVLQEMAGRLGLATKQGLPTVIRRRISRRVPRAVLIAIILAAIVFGNAAYEAGNIAGGVLGMEAVLGKGGVNWFPWICGSVAFLLLWFGTYRVLERVFTSLVVLMSLSFVLCAIMVRPDLWAMLKGFITPTAEPGELFTILALIGTTVVPYNLFLYASLVSEKWSGTGDLKSMRQDISLSVGIGGLVSMAIVVTAAGSGLNTIQGIVDLTAALEPLYGSAARYGLGIGLFAAGISSAITAPLAAAYVARQCFDWPGQHTDWRFRLTWILVLIFGVSSLSLGIRPLEIIYAAQVANAILLPVIALFLWWVVRNGTLMGSSRNSTIQDFLALAVIGIVTLLASRTVLTLLGI